jgi:hypothetical protein
VKAVHAVQISRTIPFLAQVVQKFDGVEKKSEVVESDFCIDFLINSTDFSVNSADFFDECQFSEIGPADPIKFRQFFKKSAVFLNPICSSIGVQS